MTSDKSVEVRIFGRIHHLRGEDPEHVREAARMVDENMQSIASRMETADGYRAAVLAALQLADRLLEERAAVERSRAQTEAKVARMIEMLDRGQAPEEPETQDPAG